MIVSKAVKMAEMMNIPIIGLVENMSYFKCPDCGKEHKIFGDSHIDEIAEKHNLKVLAKLPVNPKISAACDKGMIELFDGESSFRCHYSFINIYSIFGEFIGVIAYHKGISLAEDRFFIVLYAMFIVSGIIKIPQLVSW